MIFTSCIVCIILSYNHLYIVAKVINVSGIPTIYCKFSTLFDLVLVSLVCFYEMVS